jgi:hypothetical protein
LQLLLLLLGLLRAPKLGLPNLGQLLLFLTASVATCV